MFFFYASSLYPSHAALPIFYSHLQLPSFSGSFVPHQIYEHLLLTILKRSLISLGLITGSGLQLWFNYQSRTFAGKSRYKMNTDLDGIVLMLNMLPCSTTSVLGFREFQTGVSVHD